MIVLFGTFRSRLSRPKTSRWLFSLDGQLDLVPFQFNITEAHQAYWVSVFLHPFFCDQYFLRAATLSQNGATLKGLFRFRSHHIFALDFWSRLKSTACTFERFFPINSFAPLPNHSPLPWGRASVRWPRLSTFLRQPQNASWEKPRVWPEKTALEWVRSNLYAGPRRVWGGETGSFWKYWAFWYLSRPSGTVWNTRKNFLFQGLLMGRKFYAFPTCRGVNVFGRGKRAIFLSWNFWKQKHLGKNLTPARLHKLTSVIW